MTAESIDHLERIRVHLLTPQAMLLPIVSFPFRLLESPVFQQGQPFDEPQNSIEHPDRKGNRPVAVESNAFVLAAT